ncbi:MAG: SBBP repeat-containing protein [Bacteroidota bacterium]
MKNLIILVLNIFFISTKLCSQGFEWGHSFGDAVIDEVTNVLTDPEGNLITIGIFTSVVDFDPGPGVAALGVNGSNDIFIQKSDPKGNFIWVKKIGGAQSDNSEDAKFDQYGNLYLLGTFNLTVDFDPGPGVFNLYGGSNSTDAFVLKLDPNGNFIWAKQFNAADNADFWANNLALDSNGSIYVAGRYSGKLDADPGNGTFYLSTAFYTYTEAAVIKLDATGNFSWAKTYGGSYNEEIASIAVDAQGGLISFGTFQGSVDFDPGPGVFYGTTDQASTDFFLQKLDSLGNFVWGRHWESNASFRANSACMKQDDNGNIILAGTIMGKFDSDPGPDVRSLNAVNFNIFLEKLDTAGKFLWAKQIGGINFGWLNGIDVDELGNIYTTGNFEHTCNFSTGITPMNLTADSSSNAFVLKSDFLGNSTWVKQILGQSSGAIVHVSPRGDVYVGGSFRGTVNLNPGPDPVYGTSLGIYNFFIVKYNQEWHFYGAVFNDLNHNGVQDTDEYGMKGIRVGALNTEKYATTDKSGVYNLYFNAVGDTLQPILHWAGWTTTPAWIIPDSTQAAMNFAASGPPAKDVCIAVVEKTPFRPGFVTEIVIQVTNVGTVPVDSIPVNLVNVAPEIPYQLELISAEPAATVLADNAFEWTTGPIGIYETAEIHAFFKAPDSLLIGDAVDISTQAILSDDAFSFNNDSRVHTLVVGSFDPNEKQVDVSKLEPEMLDSTELRYVIRFQNTGNYPTNFVVIRDTISANLDLSTLRILSADHPYSWRLYDPRILEFRFDPIYLPAKTTNEPKSHGFVAFGIQPKHGLTTGNNILNRAGIYFDYNAPVITNTVNTSIQKIVKAFIPTQVRALKILPNPASDWVQIQLPEAIAGAGRMQIFDYSGRLVYNTRTEERILKVSLVQLPAGVYRVVFTNAEQIYGGKLEIIK